LFLSSPKFIIASGELTKILIHTDVLRYLEFKQIAGSFVYRDGRISKVPSTEMEALRSNLMGIFEKRRAKKFFEFVQGWKDDDPTTHQGESITFDLGGKRMMSRRAMGHAELTRYLVVAVGQVSTSTRTL
jgi:RAB protein geranylgeranyltransferase component A